MLRHRSEVYWGGCVMTKPAVVLIGADKGGVGKTTVVRTLLDYFAHRQVRARAFDTCSSASNLAWFIDSLMLNQRPISMQNSQTLIRATCSRIRKTSSRGSVNLRSSLPILA